MIIVRAIEGFSNRYSPNFSPIACSTAVFTSEETNLSFVCDENLGSGTLTEITAVNPSRASSPEALVSVLPPFLVLLRPSLTI